jgi:mono/diheme cytochrome c family protein
MKTRMVRLLWVGAALLVAALLIAACGATPEPTAEPTQPPAAPPAAEEPAAKLVPPQMPSAVRGEAIFAANCVSCHGEAGDGTALPGAANFTDVEFMRHKKPSEFFEAISGGIDGTAMSAWGGTLSEMDTWDVLYYAVTFATSPEEVAKGKRLFMANCVSCHGEAGDGSGLAGAANFTDQAFMSSEDPAEFFEKIGEGVSGTAMPAWGETLSEDEIWALVNYVWTFAYDYGQ